MATALHKTRTIDMKNLAVQCQQLKDNTGAAVNITELTALTGITATAAEISTLAGVTAGTVTASKAVVVDANKHIDILGLPVSGLKIGTSGSEVVVTASGTEMNVLTGATNANSGTGKAAILGTSGAITLAGAITPSAGIAAAGGFSISPRGWWVGQTAPQVSTDFNDSTPVITETYVSEIYVPANCTITGVAVFNGSNVTGNIQVALATSAGAPIAAAKSAATAGSGTDAMQRVPFATPYAAVGPATYFIQVQYSSGTARYNTHVIGNHGVLVQTSQVFGTLASFTPPSTFVTAVSNVAALY